MDKRFSIDGLTDATGVVKGLTIAPGVVEAIVSAAVASVEGVSQVGVPGIPSGIISTFNRHYPSQGILITADEAGDITVTVHVHIFFGYRLQEVAEYIRATVADTLHGQVGVEIVAVDVFVDGIQFPA